MNRGGKYVIFAVCVMLLFPLLMAFPLAAHPKDKILIVQAVSLPAPLSPDYTFACVRYYDLWVKDVNAEGGISVKEYGKRLPIGPLKYDDTSDICAFCAMSAEYGVRWRVQAP